MLYIGLLWFHIHFLLLSEIVLIYLFMLNWSCFQSKGELVLGRLCQDDVSKITMLVSVNIWRLNCDVMDNTKNLWELLLRVFGLGKAALCWSE